VAAAGETISGHALKLPLAGATPISIANAGAMPTLCYGREFWLPGSDVTTFRTYSQPTPYTRNVVAFQGQQNGGWISVVSYNSPVIGWIDGTTIRPFQSVYPGHGCIVTVDAAQRPIFRIH
jgi:hypothetical protein